MCEKELPVNMFFRRNNRPRGYVSACKKCTNERARTKYNSNGKLAARMRKYRNNLRKQIFNKFNNICFKCGFNDWRALQIDHIKGNGAEERKKFGNTTVYFYNYLLSLSDEELHKKYQCLCANCNWIKRYENKELYRNF